MKIENESKEKRKRISKKGRERRCIKTKIESMQATKRVWSKQDDLD